MSTVVIGAGFGDEGKGLITDFETRRLKSLLVSRFNGGAQAGHTVKKGSVRYVFGHLSSGSFAGADTYLSSNFIVNPMILEREMQAVSNHASNPWVYMHRDARVTTIYDMAINSLVELSRGVNRHGSCGMGINETVTRHEKFPLSVSDLRLVSQAESAIIRIKTEWIPARLKELGITDIPMQYKQALDTRAYDVAKELCRAVNKFNIVEIQNKNDLGKNRPYPIVFEGAQGLMLDEFLGDFPHVTRSITGLPYAIVAAKELGVKSLKPVYVTRAYATRHGAGVLPHEGQSLGFSPVDLTNVENPWQQKIRFAPLDVKKLKAYIDADYQRGFFVAQALGIKLEQPTLAVTCLDQIPDSIPVYLNEHISTQIRRDNLPTVLQTNLNIKVSHISYGPGAEDVQYVE